MGFGLGKEGVLFLMILFSSILCLSSILDAILGNYHVYEQITEKHCKQLLFKKFAWKQKKSFAK